MCFLFYINPPVLTTTFLSPAIHGAQQPPFPDVVYQGLVELFCRYGCGVYVNASAQTLQVPRTLQILAHSPYLPLDSHAPCVRRPSLRGKNCLGTYVPPQAKTMRHLDVKALPRRTFLHYSPRVSCAAPKDAAPFSTVAKPTPPDHWLHT